MFGKTSSKFWIVALVVAGIGLCALAFVSIGRITNRDRLVVLNSNFETLLEDDLRSKISVDAVPSDLSKGEVDQMKELLAPANRHLLSDIYGRPLRIRLVIDSKRGGKRLIALAPCGQ